MTTVLSEVEVQFTKVNHSSFIDTHRNTVVFSLTKKEMRLFSSSELKSKVNGPVRMYIIEKLYLFLKFYFC